MSRALGNSTEGSPSTPKTTTGSYVQPSDISLSSVYELPRRHKLLYSLLLERDATANISHKVKPNWDDHVSFVESAPYRCWHFIVADGRPVGAVYLTKRNEIGIAVFKHHQGRGYGTAAVKKLLAAYEPLPAIPAERTGYFLANIAPGNSRSIAFFRNLGFVMAQVTYKLER